MSVGQALQRISISAFRLLGISLSWLQTRHSDCCTSKPSISDSDLIGSQDRPFLSIIDDHVRLDLLSVAEAVPSQPPGLRVRRAFVAHSPWVNFILDVPPHNALSATIAYSFHDVPHLTKACACSHIRATELRILTRLETMASSSRLQIFKSKPIGDGLNSVRNSFNSLCREQQIPASASALDRIGIEGTSI
jgi:hypothetical protein